MVEMFPPVSTVELSVQVYPPMPRHNYSPAYLRYLRARLWNLARPGFWGTAIFLSVVGLFIKEYWTKPDLFTQTEENSQLTTKTADEVSLSDENKAIAADIDNLPTILHDFEQANLLNKSIPTKKTDSSASKGLLNGVDKNNQKSTGELKSSSDDKKLPSPPTQPLENPFLTQAENLLQNGSFQSGSKFKKVNSQTSVQLYTKQTPFGLGTQLASQTNSNQNDITPSALETALNQLPNQPQWGGGNSTSTQINPTEQFLPTNSVISQINTPNTGFSNTTNYTQQKLTNQPQSTINPFSTTTGYTQQGLINQSSNPVTVPSYAQPGVVNLPPNSVTVPGYSQLGTGSQLLNSTSTPNTNRDTPSIPYSNQENRFINNLNNGQVVPNITQPNSILPSTQVIPPRTSGVSNNLTPYNTFQTPSQSNVTQTTAPVGTQDSRNLNWQQPTQLSPYNQPSPYNQLSPYNNSDRNELRRELMRQYLRE
jgi:hypothetical protein